MSYMTAEEVRQQHISVLGPELGTLFYYLYNQCAWLHVKWRQFVDLYGTDQERIDVLNQAASVFFRIAQGALFHDILLNLTRLTDRPVSINGQKNLTIQSLPALISDRAFRTEIKRLIKLAVASTEFARDWRNRFIAHRNFELVMNGGAEPISRASRDDIDAALQAVSRVIERVGGFYLKSELHLDLAGAPHDAESLLYVLRDGLQHGRECRLRNVMANRHS